MSDTKIGGGYQQIGGGVKGVKDQGFLGALKNLLEYVNDYARQHGISETEAIIMCSSAKEVDNIASELDSLRLEFYLDFYDDDFDDDYIGEFWFDYEDIM